MRIRRWDSKIQRWVWAAVHLSLAPLCSPAPLRQSFHRAHRKERIWNLLGSQALRDPDATGSSAAPLAEGTAPLPRPRGFAMIAWPRRRGERWNESTHGIWNCFPLEPLPSPLSPPPSPRSPDCCPRPPRYSPAPLPRPGAGEAVDGKLILPSSPDLRASKKSAPGTWWDRAGRGIPMRARTLRSDPRAGDAPPPSIARVPLDHWRRRRSGG